MAENITNLNSDGFKEAIASSQLTLVDFWAPWCGPCKAIAPILEEVATEMADQVKIGKVNVDEEPEISAQYNIRAIPTLLLFKDGKTVDQFVGMTNKDELVKRIQANA